MNGNGGTRHILSILVENRFGELCRVVGLFSGRGYNIDSLCVAPTPDPAFSKIILTTNGTDAIMEQILKQIGKLVRVLKVTDLNEVAHVEREMALFTVSTPSAGGRQEVLNLVQVFRAKVIDIAPDAITIEITGNQEKVEALLGLLKGLGIRDIVRTGPVAIPRIGAATEASLPRLADFEVPEAESSV
ncbi:MAG TPA: acetolactate synthase small subunit [Candidatus Polarisedimenticolia bacterium]|nr:acetolactate synthase small subunit [Candidatus Polarisedimenticolia bacterium]